MVSITSQCSAILPSSSKRKISKATCSCEVVNGLQEYHVAFGKCADVIYGSLNRRKCQISHGADECIPACSICKIMLDMKELPDADCDAYVLQSEQHFGLLAIPENKHGARLDYITVRTQSLYLYVHKNHPLAKEKAVNFGMLKGDFSCDEKPCYPCAVSKYCNGSL